MPLTVAGVKALHTDAPVCCELRCGAGMAAYNHRINDEEYFRVVDVETLDLPYRDRARQLLIRAAREVGLRAGAAEHRHCIIYRQITADSADPYVKQHRLTWSSYSGIRHQTRATATQLRRRQRNLMNCVCNNLLRRRAQFCRLTAGESCWCVRYTCCFCLTS